METYLKFTEEETKKAMIALKSQELCFVLWDLDQQLRSWYKYSNDFEDIEDALDETRRFLHERLSQEGLTLDDLIE